MDFREGGCLLTRATAAGQIQLIATRGQFPRHAEGLTVYVSLSKEMGLPRWLRGKEPACNAGRAGSTSGSGRSPGGGHGNPLQYSCHGKIP